MHKNYLIVSAQRLLDIQRKSYLCLNQIVLNWIQIGPHVQQLPHDVAQLNTLTWATREAIHTLQPNCM